MKKPFWGGNECGKENTAQGGRRSFSFPSVFPCLRNGKAWIDGLYADRRGRIIYLAFGLLSAFPFLCDFFWFLEWLCFTPLIYPCLRFSLGKRECAKAFFAFGLAFSLCSLSWLPSIYPIAFLGFSRVQGLAVTVSVYAFLSLLTSLKFVLAGLFVPLCRRLMSKNVFGGCTAFALIFVIIEALFAQSELLFPWCAVSVSQTGFLPLIQPAAYFSSYIITFFIILVNALTAAWSAGISEIKYSDGEKNLEASSHRQCKIPLSLCVFAAYLAIGEAIFLFAPCAENTRVAIVEPRVETAEKWGDGDSTAERKITLAFEAEMKSADSGTEVIILPETVLTEVFDLSDDDTLSESLPSRLSEKAEAPLIAGLFVTENKKIYNAAVMFRNGKQVGIYKKQKLVAFSEHIPARAFIEAVLPLFSRINAASEISHGEESTVFDLGEKSALPMICYDVLFPSVAAKSGVNGADLLVTVTNDAWFDNPLCAYQHGRHALLRGVENRLPSTFVSNSGGSFYADSKGRILIKKAK